VGGWGLGVGVWGFGVGGLGFAVCGWGFEVRGLGFRVWGLGFGVQGFGLLDSGFGIRVSVFGFRVSVLGFQMNLDAALKHARVVAFAHDHYRPARFRPHHPVLIAQRLRMRGLRPGRARHGMTLAPLLWLHCSISGKCFLEYIIGTQCGQCARKW